MRNTASGRMVSASDGSVERKVPLEALNDSLKCSLLF
jgi:hypothetical protein